MGGLSIVCVWGGVDRAPWLASPPTPKKDSIDGPPKILSRLTPGPRRWPGPEGRQKKENGIFGISASRGLRKSSFAMCLVGGFWHEASASDCLPLAAAIGLSPLLILTLCGPERVLVLLTEPPDDLSCLTTPRVGRPGDGLLPVPLTRGIQMHTLSPCGGLPTPALT